MREIPNCKICKLKCHGCESYDTCLFRKEENGHKIEECTMVASKYHLWEDYLHSERAHLMTLCGFQDECKTLYLAWND